MRTGICALTAALLMLVWSPTILACASGGGHASTGHGGRGGHGSSCDRSAPPVRWCDKAVADVEADGSGPFAVYFCSEEAGKYAGEGAQVVTACRKANAKCKPTIWESATVLNDLESAGISTCFKVAATKNNQELFKKYCAGLNTLVLCAPNGDRLVTLTGDQCTEANVSRELKCFREKLEAWKKPRK